MRLRTSILFTILTIIFISCGSSSSGNIKIIFHLPVDYDGICTGYEEGDEDYLDYTYCITRDDKVEISVYSKEDLSLLNEKVYTGLESKKDGIVELTLKLQEKPENVLIFTRVINQNKKLKLTGGIAVAKSGKTDVFMALAGDFARVVSDRSRSDSTSLESYFEEGGSKGSAAVALKDGRIFMAGGYDLEEEEVTARAVIFDMKSLSIKNVKALPTRLYDHIAALLDDGSTAGKVVVGLGSQEDGLNNSVWIYDPENDQYTPLSLGASAMTKAKAVTINGEVYIVGGCTGSEASDKVYKISAKNGKITAERFATLKQGRCNHAVVDVSANGKVRILVIGGSSDYKPEGKENPVIGRNFAEIVTGNSSQAIEITNRFGGDDAELKMSGLISPAAATLTMDDLGTSEKIVSVAGGYIRFITGDDEDSRITSPRFFVFSEHDGKFVYDANSAPFDCARPSMAALGTWKNDFSAYAAVNCGTKEIGRTSRSSVNQIIFILQVKRATTDEGTEVFSSSVKESLMDGNKDSDSDAEIVDGPVASDALGQVFMLGGKYVYQAGSYAVPGTEYADAPKNKPPKPIIHVAFEYPIQKPMSYRNIYDKVQMNLKDTCVAMKDDPNTCDPKWEKKYYIRYKWEMTETPTPLLEQSRLALTEMDASAGQWLTDDGKRDNPKRASFTGLMITPRKYNDQPNDSYNADECAKCGDEPSDPNNEDKYFFKTLSEYFICRQKYCEETKTKYYKVTIQAETVDKKTDLTSDTAEVTVVPRIISQARVVAQLTWKQGFKTKAESESKEGASIDLDLHLIKKESLEAPQYGFTPTEGLLGTLYRWDENESACPSTLPECEKYWRHDDCSFADPGLTGVENGRTIQWHASLDIDNTWGGGSYEKPENIGLGPVPDANSIIDDQYLVVVGYVNCVSNYSEGGDRCDPQYTGEDSAYEVDARVEIFVDGDEAPRKGSSDSYSATTRDFKIKVNEWKVIAVVKWDSGNAIVTDTAMPDEGITTDPVNHPVCTYDNSDAVLIPIWDADTYRSHITTPDYDGMVIGSCD